VRFKEKRRRRRRLLDLLVDNYYMSDATLSGGGTVPAGEGIWAALSETGTFPAFQGVGLVRVANGRLTWTRRRSIKNLLPFRRSRLEIEITNAAAVELVTVWLANKQSLKATAVRVTTGSKTYTFRAGHGGNLVQNKQVSQRLYRKLRRVASAGLEN
jgi:hypothetical protein